MTGPISTPAEAVVAVVFAVGCVVCMLWMVKIGRRDND